MTEWQPIETAPRAELELILLYNGKVLVGAAWESGWADWFHDYVTPAPTHWMRLPPPPKGQS